MTISYCYDTEFLDDGSTIDLISIGIVCEDGREYYAVNSDMPRERISRDDWLCQNVVPHLPLVDGKIEQLAGNSGWVWALDMTSPLVKPKQWIADDVREFLLPAASDHNPELWAYFGAYDHVVLAQLWGKMISLPTGIPMYTHDLKQEMDRLGIASTAVPHNQDAHDALADARWNWAMLSDIRRRQTTDGSGALA
ncbi:hypothetical protein B7435_30375 [Mycolicibacterium peregrinum]|uniref:3'-5' exoribonuclease domain-containing protein n=1 Tax=Mycolicibacterium peregrinum TaxID=43304 RepID=UPI000B4B6C50|nr:3'-5' exoribonuclease [Mycolicibacterium peregrinum]OWL95591.1 hypothetical protein B7435_30375 [Mycolicibacterium peregrinum]